MALRKGKRRQRHSRNLEGWNAQGFFSPGSGPIAYTGATDIDDFIRNAAPGSIGIFEAQTGATVTATPAAGTQFYFAQKQSDRYLDQDRIKKSNILVWNPAQLLRTKTDYDVPVLQENAIGFNGTTGSLNISIVGGLQEFVASARETTPANQPFPVTEGRSVVRSGSPSDYDIALQIVQDINNEFDYEQNSDIGFVSAGILSDQAGTALAGGPFAVSVLNESPTVLFAADVTAQIPAGGVLKILGDTFVALSSVEAGGTTTVVLDRAYQGDTATLADTDVVGDITKANVDAGEVGIKLTALSEETTFEVSRSEDLADADVSVLVPWKQGSGAAFQVASMEDEAAVFDGETTINAPFRDDFGFVDKFVDDESADQYAVYFVSQYANPYPGGSSQPNAVTVLESNIVIAAIEGSDLETQLDAILVPTVN